MTDPLEELTRLLEERYAAPSGEELRARAEREAELTYGEKALSARQSAQTKDSALERELEALTASYAGKRAEAAADARQAVSDFDRNSLSRGMQRSSYASASRARLEEAGLAAGEALASEQALAEKDVASRRAELADQLAQTLSRYEQDRQTSARSNLDSLLAKEAENAGADREARLDAAKTLYEYTRQAEKDRQEQENWLAEFNARYPARTGGGSGKKKTAAATPSSARDSLSDLKALLGK